MAASYHIAQNGEKNGPFDEPTVYAKLASGAIQESDLCWTEGMETWLPISEVLGTATATATESPPPLTPSGTSPSSAYNVVTEGQGNKPPMPETYMVSAILVTLLCCLPLGIVSIVYATQVSVKYQAGDYTGAAEASDKAKFWYQMSMLAVVIFLAIGFVLASLT